MDRRDNYNPKAIIGESTEQVVKGWTRPKMGLKPYFAGSEGHTIWVSLPKKFCSHHIMSRILEGALKL